MSDFKGDGARTVACLGWEPSGEGNVTMRNADGKVLWTRAMAGFPGPLEPWNFGALTYAGPGRFTGTNRSDLIVFARRSTMHSDEGFLLNGATGEIVWRRDGSYDGNLTWGFGGTPIVAADQDGDGADDIVSLYPVNLTVVSGRDGKQLVGRTAANALFPGIWGAYCTPTAFDLTGSQKEVLVWASGYVVGITDFSGTPRWFVAPEKQNDMISNNVSAYPIEGTTPDAYNLAVVNGDRLTAYDSLHGNRLWDFTLPGSAKQALIADLDGDQHDDLLFWFENKVGAVALKQGHPEMLWTVEMPAFVHDVIVADTKGDGGLEAVVTCSNGFIYGLNQSASGNLK